MKKYWSRLKHGIHRRLVQASEPFRRLWQVVARNKHVLYAKYVIRHKWFVFWACANRGLIWRGIKHDWTKFLPSEWFPYVEYFYGEKIERPNAWTFKDGQRVPVMEHRPEVKRAFDLAWNYHEKRHSHHWQYWLLSPDNPRPRLNEQSYDGGMTHVTITTTDHAPIPGGRDAAIVYYDTIEWWKPDQEAVELLRQDLENTPVPLPMPHADRVEMLCDWIGAGMALGKPDTWKWYESNKDHIFLHPETREWVENELRLLEQAHVVGVLLGFEKSL